MVRCGRWRSIPIPVDPEGRYLFSIIHDITARSEAETTLVDYNQRLKRAEDISGIGHWEFP